MRKNILIIEDDPIFSKIFMADAKNKGIDCTVCSNVEEIAGLSKFDFGAMVIDYSLGIYAHYNGINWQKIIKKINAPIPIVLTSSADKLNMFSAWPLQNKKFISKNYGISYLVNSVLGTTEQQPGQKIMRASALCANGNFRRVKA